MLNPNAYFFSFYAIPNIVVSTLIFVVGLFVFCQNPKNSSNIFFFLFCLSLNFWLYGRAVMYCCKEPEIALAWAKIFAKLGVVNIAPLVYAFSVHWLGLYRAQKKYVIAGFVLSMTFYFLILFTPYGLLGVRHYFWGYYPVYGPICKIFLVFFMIYFVSAFRNFFTEWKKAGDPSRHKQIQLVTIAYVISFFGSIDFIPKIIHLSLYPFGYLCVFIWTLVLAYAIVRYRIMDIQTVIHKTLMWFFSTVIAISPLALFVYTLQPWLQGRNPKTATLFYLALTLSFYFYFRAIQPRLDHFFRRKMANLQAVSARFSADLVQLKNLRDLLQSTIRMLRRTLFVRNVSIYLKDSEGKEVYPAIAKQARGLKPLSLDHPFLTWLEQYDGIVVSELAEANPAFAYIKEPMREYVSRVGSSIIVPFVLGGKIIGALNLGQKDNLRKYTSEEIYFLSQIKSALTIAFSNSLQFIAMQESLQKWNVELELKVQERTKQLQETQAQLVQAEKMATIGTLAGGVAHEINNPLTAVLTNAQILKMDADGDDLDSLNLIEEGAKRCQNIIQKLMKYSRKAEGLTHVSQINLNLVLDDAVKFLAYQLQQENIGLEINKPLKISLIKGNENEFEQVITNFILNAKDAIKMSRKQGSIKVLLEEKPYSVSLSVIDDGIGISEANLNKIFDPFFTTKEIGKGTGLGLAVTHGIVQKYGGKIEVKSKIGKGTIFTVDFPKVSEGI